MLAAGVLAGLVTGASWSWVYAPTVGWAVAALVYSSWVWIVISGLDADQTAKLASREDPTRGVSDLLVILLSLASLFSLGIILVQANAAQGALEAVLAGLAVVSVALSWILLHTLFTLHYARIYYTDGGNGVNFNQKEPPRYSDFAYLAFTIGMTFQVSDTNITTHRERSTALQHALLSFVFGSVILATTINLVAGLSSGH
ncbi:MAG: hypothetical protein QOG18_789 [Microbacteriaceae bacterium]|nr:hypothetical protein [Microbacteriaceae bacterium]MDQ1526176.1 hypothetical protein [Microbacteriaceae bacterium]